MSKKVLSIGLAIVGVVLAIPTVGASLGLSALAIGALEVGIALTQGLLLGPKAPKVPDSLQNGARDRLYASLDPTTPRKIVFGNTAMATDVRYQTFTGADQEYYWEVICCASHEVQSIDEIWLDNEKAWSSAGGVLGRYVNYLTVTTRTVGTNANGVAIDSVWTSSCTLTGCAYVVLQFKLTGNSDSEDSPFSSGVTSRITIRGKGAKVYDPRLDSTVTGGSGSQRANNQSTWAWNDNASRNSALQELWYELGWKINGKLAVGKGVPPARLDLPAFITAANICDESIALNGGGSEPRYRTDGVLSEGDDPPAVRDALCSQMNAQLRDAGGTISLNVFKNDLASPDTPSGRSSFDERDILGDEHWSQTPPLSDYFNIVRGRRIDPSDNALYQPVDFPEVSLGSSDGIDRIDTVEYTMTQSNGQAQRLAKQRLQRKQYQGRFSFTGGPAWWSTSFGRVVPLSHDGLGWASKLFRVARHKITRGGPVELVLVEENAANYAWDNSEAAPVTAGTPTIYDPTRAPLPTAIRERRTTTGNLLTDTLFSRRWTLTSGASRHVPDAIGGFAQGDARYYLELSPDASTEKSAKSEIVRVTAGERYYFAVQCQRGTTLGSGSRLNAGGTWYAADKTTVIAAAAEMTQQTPSSLTAGVVPAEIKWDEIAPAGAFYYQMKIYTPALASSSGTFRVEDPRVTRAELSGDVTRWLDGPTQSTVFLYDYTGTTAETGQFPRDLTFVVNTPKGQITSGITWQYLVKTGKVNGFTNSSGVKSMTGSGTGTLTVSSLGATTSQVEIRATIGSSLITKTITLTKQFAAAPVGGGGGGGGSSTTLVSVTSGFTSINSTTFTDLTGTMSGTTPSGVTSVNINVNLDATPTGGSTGNSTVEFKVQRLISGTWTDIGTARSDTSEWDSSAGALDAASVSFVQANTGLSGSTAYSWRVVGRLTSGTRNHAVTGSVTVTA